MNHDHSKSLNKQPQYFILISGFFPRPASAREEGNHTPSTKCKTLLSSDRVTTNAFIRTKAAWSLPLFTVTHARLHVKCGGCPLRLNTMVACILVDMVRNIRFNNRRRIEVYVLYNLGLWKTNSWTSEILYIKDLYGYEDLRLTYVLQADRVLYLSVDNIHK